MKVEVKESSKKAERPFPKLMQHVEHNWVVLFISYSDGTLLTSAGANAPIGRHETRFDPEKYKDFEGEIILSND